MKHWGDYAGWGAIGLTVLFFGYLLSNDSRSLRDRAGLHQDIERQREMLDARAEIQVILIRRAAEGRPLTAEEKARIGELCHAAEYSRVPGGCTAQGEQGERGATGPKGEAGDRGPTGGR